MNTYRLLEHLDREGIDTVVFDIDNTLFATAEYYHHKMSQIGIEIARKIEPEGDLEAISSEIKSVVFKQYEKSDRKPSLIDEQYLVVLREYFKGNMPEQIEVMVRSFFADFYSHSPTPFENTPRVLRVLIEAKKKVALHSHAQDDWTAVKVDLLDKFVGTRLPYLATDIDKEKDSSSWLKAFELVSSKPQSSMVVGDNFKSDILPPVKVGCKNAAYVNRARRESYKTYKLDDSVKIIEVEDIGDILDASF